MKNSHAFIFGFVVTLLVSVIFLSGILFVPTINYVTTDDQEKYIQNVVNRISIILH